MRKFARYYVKDKCGNIVMQINSNGKHARIRFPEYEFCEERYSGYSPALIDFSASQISMLVFAYDREEGKKFIRFLEENEVQE